MGKYAIGIVAALAVVMVGYPLIFSGDAAPVDNGQLGAVQTSETLFNKSGSVNKDLPDLPPNIWHFVYIGTDGQTYGAEMIFDEESVCAGSSASGPCNPDIFVQGRAAHLEGVVEDNTVRVVMLTFTQAL
jgi:hypothetical protein